MIKVNKFVVILLLSLVCIETVNAAFTIKVIRKAIKVAERYAAATMGEGLSGTIVSRVLKNIDKTLGPLGLNYYVSMEEFANAAVRVGLNRRIGILVYHVVDNLSPIGKK